MTDGSIANGPSGDTKTASPASPPEAPKGLPRLTFFVILAALVTLFLAVRGAVWRDPWNAGALDSAIFWSYLPIPFLVAGGLALARRFSWRFLFLDSLTITLLKYAITFSIALVFWATKSPPPPPPKAPPPPKSAAIEAPPPPPTPLVPERQGTARGIVKNAAGEPVSGAFVYVSAGLEAFVFERPTDPVRVENDGITVRARLGDEAAQRWPASLVVARAGQPILGRSLDSHLHTLVASGGDTSGTTFNIPMMSSGAWSTVVVREPAKVSRLRCTVHPNGESNAYLVVLDHPYFTTTAADGSFRLEGIPAVKVTLSAWHGVAGETSTEVQIPARAESVTELKLVAPATTPVSPSAPAPR